MSEQGGDGAPESHSVHGAVRDDGRMQEEPTGAEGVDEEEPAMPTEPGPALT